MRVFKDKKGVEWELEITVGTKIDVEARLGFNLYALAEDGAKGLGELLGDCERLVQLLYVLCRGQCEERGVSPEHFARLFTGEVLEAAADAFVEEYIGFFPNRQVREGLQRVVQQAEKMVSRHLEGKLAEADRRLAQLDLEAEIASLSRTLTGSSGSAPAGSASTPAA